MCWISGVHVVNRLLPHLDALLVQGVLVEVEDGGLDGAGRRQHGQADVDGVAALGVQNDDLLSFAFNCCFLRMSVCSMR